MPSNKNEDVVLDLFLKLNTDPNTKPVVDSFIKNVVDASKKAMDATGGIKIDVAPEKKLLEELAKSLKLTQFQVEKFSKAFDEVGKIKFDAKLLKDVSDLSKSLLGISDLLGKNLSLKDVFNVGDSLKKARKEVEDFKKDVGKIAGDLGIDVGSKLSKSVTKTIEVLREELKQLREDQKTTTGDTREDINKRVKAKQKEIKQAGLTSEDAATSVIFDEAKENKRLQSLQRRNELLAQQAGALGQLKAKVSELTAELVKLDGAEDTDGSIRARTITSLKSVTAEVKNFTKSAEELRRAGLKEEAKELNFNEFEKSLQRSKVAADGYLKSVRDDIKLVRAELAGADKGSDATKNTKQVEELNEKLKKLEATEIRLTSTTDEIAAREQKATIADQKRAESAGKLGQILEKIAAAESRKKAATTDESIKAEQKTIDDLVESKNKLTQSSEQQARALLQETRSRTLQTKESGKAIASLEAENKAITDTIEKNREFRASIEEAFGSKPLSPAIIADLQSLEEEEDKLNKKLGENRASIEAINKVEKTRNIDLAGQEAVLARLNGQLDREKTDLLALTSAEIKDEQLIKEKQEDITRTEAAIKGATAARKQEIAVTRSQLDVEKDIKRVRDALKNETNTKKKNELRDELKTLQRELEKTKAGIDETTKSFEAFGEAGNRAIIDIIARGLNQTNARIEALLEKSAKFGLTLKDIKTIATFALVEGLGSALKFAGNELQTLANRVVETTKNFVQYVQEQENVRKINGASREVIAGLTLGFKELGFAGTKGDVKDVADVLGQLAQKANEAAQGQDAASKAFRTFGIKVTEQNGAIKTTEKLLKELNDRFNDIPNSIAKTAALSVIAGEQGARQIAPLLGNLEKFTELAKKNNLVLSDESVEAAKKYKEEIENLDASLTGFENLIGGKIAPVLSDFNKILAELVNDAINTPEALQGLVEIAKALEVIIGGLTIAAGGLTIALSSGISNTTEAFTELFADIKFGLNANIDFFRELLGETKKEESAVRNLDDAFKSLSFTQERLNNISKANEEANTKLANSFKKISDAISVLTTVEREQNNVSETAIKKTQERLALEQLGIKLRGSAAGVDVPGSSAGGPKLTKIEELKELSIAQAKADELEVDANQKKLDTLTRANEKFKKTLQEENAKLFNIQKTFGDELAKLDEDFSKEKNLNQVTKDGLFLKTEEEFRNKQVDLVKERQRLIREIENKEAELTVTKSGKASDDIKNQIDRDKATIDGLQKSVEENQKKFSDDLDAIVAARLAAEGKTQAEIVQTQAVVVKAIQTRVAIDFQAKEKLRASELELAQVSTATAIAKVKQAEGASARRLEIARAEIENLDRIENERNKKFQAAEDIKLEIIQRALDKRKDITVQRLQEIDAAAEAIDKRRADREAEIRGRAKAAGTTGSGGVEPHIDTTQLKNDAQTAVDVVSGLNDKLQEKLKDIKVTISTAAASEELKSLQKEIQATQEELNKPVVGSNEDFTKKTEESTKKLNELINTYIARYNEIAGKVELTNANFVSTIGKTVEAAATAIEGTGESLLELERRITSDRKINEEELAEFKIKKDEVVTQRLIASLNKKLALAKGNTDLELQLNDQLAEAELNLLKVKQTAQDQLQDARNAQLQREFDVNQSANKKRIDQLERDKQAKIKKLREAGETELEIAQQVIRVDQEKAELEKDAIVAKIRLLETQGGKEKELLDARNELAAQEVKIQDILEQINGKREIDVANVLKGTAAIKEQKSAQDSLNASVAARPAGGAPGIGGGGASVTSGAAAIEASNAVALGQIAKAQDAANQAGIEKFKQAQEEEARLVEEAAKARIEAEKQLREQLLGIIKQYNEARIALTAANKEAVNKIQEDELTNFKTLQDGLTDADAKAQLDRKKLDEDFAKKRFDREEKEGQARVKAAEELEATLKEVRRSAQDDELKGEEDFIVKQAELNDQIKTAKANTLSGITEADRKKAEDELAKLQANLDKLRQAETRRIAREAEKRKKLADAEAEANEIAKTDPEKAKKVLEARKKQIDDELSLQTDFEEARARLQELGDTEAIKQLTELYETRKGIIDARAADELKTIQQEIDAAASLRQAEINQELADYEAQKQAIKDRLAETKQTLQDAYDDRANDLKVALENQKELYAQQIADIQQALIDGLRAIGVTLDGSKLSFAELFDLIGSKGAITQAVFERIAAALAKVNTAVEDILGQAPQNSQGGQAGQTGGTASNSNPSGSIPNPADSVPPIGLPGGNPTPAGNTGAGGSSTPAPTPPPPVLSKKQKEAAARKEYSNAFLKGRKSGSVAKLRGELSSTGESLLNRGIITRNQRQFILGRGLQSATASEFEKSLVAGLEFGNPYNQIRFSLSEAKGRIKFLFSQFKKKLIAKEGVLAGIDELQQTGSIDKDTAGALSALVNNATADTDLDTVFSNIDGIFNSAKEGAPNKVSEPGKGTDFGPGKGDKDTTGGASTITDTTGGGKVTQEGPASHATGAAKGEAGGTSSGGLGGGTVPPSTKPKFVVPKPKRTTQKGLLEFFFPKLTGNPREDLKLLFHSFIVTRFASVRPDLFNLPPGFEDEAPTLGDVQGAAIEYMNGLLASGITDQKTVDQVLDFFKLTGKGGGRAEGKEAEFGKLADLLLPLDSKGFIKPPGGARPDDIPRGDIGGGHDASGGGGGGPATTAVTSALRDAVTATGIGPLGGKLIPAFGKLQAVPLGAAGAGPNSITNQTGGFTVNVPVDIGTLVVVDKEEARKFKDQLKREIKEETSNAVRQNIGPGAFKR